jgi:SagB-type dehydrogenase family enzyme
VDAGTGPRGVWSVTRTVVCTMVAFAALATSACGTDDRAAERASPAATVTAPSLALPAPRLTGPLSVEEALARRRSVRDFADEPVTAAQLAQLLWAAQGVTAPVSGLRTAPSAGALYPLEVYVAVERVVGIPAGVYRYAPASHRLELVLDRRVRPELGEAALSQAAVAGAPVTIALAAVYARTTQKYGDRGRRFVHMEAGHAAQDVYLQATALGLGTVSIGAFDDDRVHAVLAMHPDEEALYLLPVGVPATR